MGTPLPSKNHKQTSLAPNCSLIGPMEGVEELAVALQAAAERGGFKSFNNLPPKAGKDPCPRSLKDTIQRGHKTPSGGTKVIEGQEN